MNQVERKPRIAFFFQHAYIDTLPFAKELIQQLANEGCQVDLYLPFASIYPAPSFASASVNVNINYVNFRPLRALPSFMILILKVAMTRKYDLFIANPVHALIYASLAAKLSRRPLIALSDELYSTGDDPLSRRERAWMNWAHRQSKFTIITDLVRANVLTKDCKLAPDHPFLELPNCPAGSPPTLDSRESRRGLGLPEDGLLVLNAGTFSRSMGCELFLESLPRLPQNVHFVFQGSSNADVLTLALCRLVEQSHRVKFLLKSVPYDMVDGVVGCCDIGVCFYTVPAPNFELCGKGSGKLCRYLRLGKPVILNRSGGLEWVAHYGAGEIAETPEELVQAIQKISANYSKYSEKALDCYRDHFAFEKYFPPIRRAIYDLVGGKK